MFRPIVSALLMVVATVILFPTTGLPGIGFASAQRIGIDICACQPAAYTFTFNFSLGCADTSIIPFQNGIGNVSCTVAPELDDNITDFSPALVTRAEVYELDQQKDVIGFSPVQGPFFDSQSFRYVSVIAGQTNNTNPLFIPSAIQLSIYAINFEEQAMVNFWVIEFTNECNIYPVILEGETIGWTILVSAVNWKVCGRILLRNHLTFDKFCRTA